MIIFLDLETTGLDPNKCAILEVAAIATDDAFNELGRFEQVTSEVSAIGLGTLDPVVQDMHLKNGLWLESCAEARIRERPPTIERVDEQFAQWVAKLVLPNDTVSFRRWADRSYVVPMLWAGGVTETNNPIPISREFWTPLAPILAGNTIGFDRGFIDRHMPCVTSMLHYRSIDVTGFNEVAKRFFPALYEGRPKSDPSQAHRAMYDCEVSLASARYYVDAFKGWEGDSREYRKAGGE